LIKSGIADPAHIAICGGSFGGYLAICGAAFEPGLYKCAITIAGIFDWAKVMKEARAYDPDSSRYDQLLRELGDPKKQQEKFEADVAHPFRQPGQDSVFIAHGERTRSPTRASRTGWPGAHQGRRTGRDQFATAKAHGFSSLKNRVELYTGSKRS